MTDWLADTLVATSALMLLVLALREPVRRRCGPAVAYALWLVPALRMGMPTLTETVQRPAQAHDLSASAGAPALDLLSAPLAGPRLMSATIEAEPVGLVAQLGGWPSLLIALWLVGAALFALRGLAAYRRQRRAILSSASDIARIGRIRLVRSPAVRGPLAFGLVDPVIAVPAHFERHFSDRERALALEHELAHHRSGDLFANAVAFALLCLHWFNPLAWASYAAFRFDQEAACDARVLSRAAPCDREPYGRAIAKAASGRALLFASALQSPRQLHKRIAAMLVSPSRPGRALGRFAVLALAGIALPLTASRAVDYVDVPAPPVAPSAPAAPQAPTAPRSADAPPAPLAPAAPVAPVAPPAPLAKLAQLSPLASALAVAAPVPPVPPLPPHTGIGRDTVHINGRTRRWEELTPSERAEVRRDLAEARIELARSKKEMERELVNARHELEKFHNGEFAREMAAVEADLARSLRDLERHHGDSIHARRAAAEAREEIRAALAEVRAIDVPAMRREAIASLDLDAVRAAHAEAEAEIARVARRLDSLDAD